MYKSFGFKNPSELVSFLNANSDKLQIVSLSHDFLIYKELVSGNSTSESIETRSDGSKKILTDDGKEKKETFFDADGKAVSAEEYKKAGEVVKEEESVSVHEDIAQNENIVTVTEYVENGTHKKIAVFKDGHEVIITNGEAVVTKDGQEVEDIAHPEEVKAYTEANKKD